MAERRFTSVTPGDPVVPPGNRRFRMSRLRALLARLSWGHWDAS